MGDLISNLFKTKAVNAGKADKPFWYTSRKSRNVFYKCRIFIWK